MYGIFTIIMCFTLLGCATQPSEANIEQATQQFITQSGQILNVKMPPLSEVASIKKVSCKNAEPLEGSHCKVLVITHSLPLVGAISIPLELRYAKKSGQWQAYIN